MDYNDETGQYDYSGSSDKFYKVGDAVDPRKAEKAAGEEYERKKDSRLRRKAMNQVYNDIAERVDFAEAERKTAEQIRKYEEEKKAKKDKEKHEYVKDHREAKKRAKERYDQKSKLWKFFHKDFYKNKFYNMTPDEIDNLYTEKKGRSL